jgi:hypothetical protein
VGGLRSGRERKAHRPSGGAYETPVKGETTLVRSGDSQPSVFANARYVAPAPAAVRKRRRVNLVPIAETLFTASIPPKELPMRIGGTKTRP